MSVPFQPINSRSDSGNFDSLYQQRLSERASIDGGGQSMQMPQPAQNALYQQQFQPMIGGGASQMQQQFQFPSQNNQGPPPAQSQFQNNQGPPPAQSQFQFQPQQQIQIGHQPGTSQPDNIVHPAVLATFLSLDQASQKKFAQSNPVAYNHIMTAIQQRASAPVSPVPSSFAPQQVQSFAPQQVPSFAPQQVPSFAPQQVQSFAPQHVPSFAEEPIKNKKKHIRKQPIQQIDTAESDNIHSSDEELNIKPSSHKAGAASAVSSSYLSIDFRSDLHDITEHGYVLNIPNQQIKNIELEACIMNRSTVLEHEPYIYIAIKEIPGDYGNSVFGKLVPEKTVNDFIFYRPENCRKTLTKPLTTSKLTLSFLQYDYTHIILNKVNIRDMRNGNTYCKINTRGPHYLTTGDSINITHCSKSGYNATTVESVDIMDIPAPDVIITESPLVEIAPDSKCSFDKTQVKCSLTFRIY